MTGRCRDLLATALAAGALIAIAGCGSGARRDAASGPPPAQLNAPPLQPPVALTASFENSVEARVATELHTSLSNLRSRLRAAPGATLMVMSKPLGYGQDQFGAIVRGALDKSTGASRGSPHLSAAQIRKETHYWNAQSDPALIAEVSRWLIDG